MKPSSELGRYVKRFVTSAISKKLSWLDTHERGWGWARSLYLLPRPNCTTWWSSSRTDAADDIPHLL